MDSDTATMERVPVITSNADDSTLLSMEEGLIEAISTTEATTISTTAAVDSGVPDVGEAVTELLPPLLTNDIATDLSTSTIAPTSTTKNPSNDFIWVQDQADVVVLVLGDMPGTYSGFVDATHRLPNGPWIVDKNLPPGAPNGQGTKKISGAATASTTATGSTTKPATAPVAVVPAVAAASLVPWDDVGCEAVVDKVLTDANGFAGEYLGILHKPTKLPHGVGKLQYKDNDWFDSYGGFWDMGKFHGQGMVLFTNGDKYKGEFSQGRRHGHGTYRWTNGMQYNGKFQLDQRTGTGTMSYANSDMYEGDFVNGQQEGQGSVVFADGSTYKGGWKAGRFHGQGKMTNSDGRVYCGSFIEGAAHGQGLEWDPLGQVVFEGEWVRGEPITAADTKHKMKHNSASPPDNRYQQQEATEAAAAAAAANSKKQEQVPVEDCKTVVNGQIWDAQGNGGDYTGIILIQTSKPHGFGRMIYQDERIHDGFWEQGHRHGHGQCLFPNGDFHEGNYKDNLRNGPGEYRWKDGQVYHGEFVDDARVGQGRFTYPPNGETYGQCHGTGMEYLHLIRNDGDRTIMREVSQNNPGMTILDNITNSDATVLLALGHALIGNTHVQRLYLKDPVLTEEAAHALAQGVAQSKIEYIDLHGNFQVLSLPASASPSPSQEHICDIFYRGIQSCNTIQSLYLNQFLTTDPGDAWRDALLGINDIAIVLPPHQHGYVQAFSHVLSRTTVLKTLDVNLYEVAEPDDMTILAHSLQQNTSITSLYLRDNSVDYRNDESLRETSINHCNDAQHLFAHGLNPNSAITTLLIEEFNFDDSCMEFLLNHWLPNCSVDHLYMPHNKIGPTGALRLIQAVANYPSVRRLDLSCNSIDYEGLLLIGNELPNLQHLTHLDLSRWWSCPQDKAKTTARQQAGQALLDGIKRNLSITEMKLDKNGFPQVVLDEIYFYLALNKTGHYLLLEDDDDHGLPPAIWSRVFVKCQSRPNFGTCLVYFYLREQPALVQQQPRRPE